MSLEARILQLASEASPVSCKTTTALVEILMTRLEYFQIICSQMPETAHAGCDPIRLPRARDQGVGPNVWSGCSGPGKDFDNHGA